VIKPVKVHAIPKKRGMNHERLPAVVAGMARRCVKAWLGKRVARNVAALVALVVAFCIVSDMGQVGARYFYCESFGLLRHDPCRTFERPDGGSASPKDEARPEQTDCCQVLSVAPLPDGATSAGCHVPPALLVAILRVSQLLNPWDSAAHGAAIALERWRPPPRSAGQRCAELMVFRT
jgi:hypothetical protein